MIHNACVTTIGNIERSSVQVFDWQYKINARAPFRLTQKLRLMLIP